MGSESDGGHEWDLGSDKVRGGKKTKGMVELKSESQIESNLKLEVIWGPQLGCRQCKDTGWGSRLRRQVALGHGEVYKVSKSGSVEVGLGQATGWSPLLLTELALGSQGSQDGPAGAQAVAPTALLQLLDSGQDLPLLRVWFLRPRPCPDPTLAPPTPTPAPTHLPPLLKVDEIPLGESFV